MKPNNTSQIWYVYMVRCTDRTLYTGIAKDLVKRMGEHNSGMGAKYTRGRTPVELVFVESANSQGEALRREYQIKQMSRDQKLRIIEGFSSDSKRTDPGHF
ncbi:MAG: GIY-YIG nuclease family protein [Candidatus Thiodiazotropha sp.]